MRNFSRGEIRKPKKRYRLSFIIQSYLAPALLAIEVAGDSLEPLFGMIVKELIELEIQ